MPTLLRSAGPITHRPWWRRALGAFGAALLVQLPAAVLLHGRLPAPWDTGVPMALGLAVFFTYHPDWWRPQWRRATLVSLAGLVALGLAVVGVSYRLGWWR